MEAPLTQYKHLAYRDARERIEQIALHYGELKRCMLEVGPLDGVDPMVCLLADMYGLMNDAVQKAHRYKGETEDMQREVARLAELDEMLEKFYDYES